MYQHLCLRLLVSIFLLGVSIASATAVSPDPDRHPGALWVVENQGLTKVATYTGALRFELPDFSSIDAVTTDYATGDTWVYGHRTVTRIRANGETDPGIELQTFPATVASAIFLDDLEGQLWLSIGNDIFRVSTNGVVLGNVSVGERAISFVHDRNRGVVWAAFSNSVTGFFPDGSVFAEIPYASGDVRDIDFDPGMDRLWIVGNSGIEWYSGAGAVGGSFADPVAPFADFISADQRGVVWVASNHEVAALSADGEILFQTDIFSASHGYQPGGRSTGLFADPWDRTAWIMNGRWIVQLDSAGNVLEDIEMIIETPRHIRNGALHFDITPPVVHIEKPTPDTFTNNDRPPVLVSYSDIGSAVDVETLTFTLDGKPLSMDCEKTHAEAVCVPREIIKDGYVTLGTVVDDYAFNRSEPASVSFTVDTRLPELLNLDPADGFLTNQASQEITGKYNEPVTLSINDNDVLLLAAEAFEHGVELAEGENIFRFRATDRAGNITDTVIRYLLDTIPPVISVSQPEDGLHTREEQVVIGGGVNEPASVSIDGKPAVMSGLTFSGSRVLQEGLNGIDIKATDLAGNAAHESVHVTRDTVPPKPPGAITVVETDNGIEIIGAPGSVDPFSEVQIVTGGDSLQDHDRRHGIALVEFFLIIQSVFADANGGFSVVIDNADLPPGRLYTRVVDRAGNISDVMPLPEPEPDRRSHPVGRLPGEFSVDPTGTANYRIPIDVPKGAGSMQPDLALLYSSRAGNGHLGVGWSLSGLSAVTRCPKTIAQDGFNRGVQFDRHDVFCLDGQRLMKKSEGFLNTVEYHTEIESFQKIGGNLDFLGIAPEQFTMKDKSGLIRHYGTTPDSRVNVPGIAMPITWAISKIEDRFGNHIAYTYQENSGANGNGEFYPKEIAWYNNQGTRIGRVVLEYETRPDKSDGYLPGGGKSAVTKRLRTVKVQAGTQLVRSYVLGYEQAPASGHSTLVSMKMCDADNRCLPATRFGWLAYQPEVGTRDHINSADVFTRGDTNGDGILDFIYRADNRIFIRFGGSMNVPVDTGISTQVTSGLLGKLWLDQSLLADMDGDGKQDLMVPHIASETYWWLKGTEQGLSIEIPEAVPFGKQSGGLHEWHNTVIDIDSDGKSELLVKHEDRLKIVRYDGNGFGAAVDLGIPVFSRQKIHVMEANGDGLPDLFITNGCSTIDPDPLSPPPQGSTGCASSGVWVSTGDGFERTARIGPASKEPVFIDANGDGLTDVLRKESDSWVLYVNTGKSWEQQAWRGGNWKHDKLRAMDWNRDGKQDLMVAEHGPWAGRQVWTVHLSDGKRFLAKQDSGFNDGAFSSAVFADLSGDGIEDLLYYGGDDNYWVARPTSIGQSLMDGIVDGQGMETAIGYLPLSLLGDDYLGHSNAGLEPEDRDKSHIRDFQGAMPVVRFFAQDTGRVLHNGSAVKIATSYRYKGAKLDIHGRGFLGFAQVQASNANTGINTINNHKQSFPFTGSVHRAEQRRLPAAPVVDLDNDGLRDHFFPGCPGQIPFSTQAIGCNLQPFAANAQIGYAESPDNGELIRLTTATAQTRKIGNAHYVFNANSTEKEHDLTGTLIRRVRTTYEYDDHGNATLVDVKTDNGQGGDLHRIRTVNTYADDTARWLLGRLATSAVTHSAPGTASITRRASFSYHPEKGQLVREELEPGSATLNLVTDYAHDAFGNGTWKTVSSGATGKHAIAARLTETVYDGKGVYPVKVRNDLGHQETWTWDARFNVRKTATGPNGLKTVRGYGSFGQQISEVAPRAASVATVVRNWCGGGTACHHENAEIRIHTAGTDGSNGIVELDRLGREVLAYGSGLDGVFTATETWYDLLGRAYLVSEPYRFDDPVVCYRFREYDNLDRIVREHRAANAAECDRRSELDITRLYDANIPPPRYTAVTTFEYSGLSTTVTPPAAAGGQVRKTRRTENVAGRLASVTEWDDSDTAIETHYAYNATGETTRVTPPSGHAITLSYDKRGRKTAMHDPDMGDWTYTHNAFGELVWQRDAKGQIVTLKYDTLGRMIQRSEPEGITNWIYDVAPGKGIDKLARVEQYDGYAEAYAYTAFGEIDTQLKIIDDFAYFTRTTYDAFGRVKDVIYPAARDIPATSADVTAPDTAGALKLTHHYSATGHLKRVQRTDNGHNTDYWQAVTASARGQLTRATLGNNLANNARYDAATGAVIELGAGSAANTNYTHQFNSYTWDNAGNLTRRKDEITGTTETYQYDRLNRLVHTKMTAAGYTGSQTFAYDAAGNITRKGNLRNFQYGEGGNGEHRPHAVIGIDRYSGNTRTGTLTYLYDANGNVEDADGRAITWSSYNKPVRIEKDSAHSEFAYGPDRARYKHIKRYANSATETTHSAGLVERIEKREGFTTRVEYRQTIVAGGQAIAIVTDYAGSGAESTRYLHKDHLGSITLITNELGKVIERHSFDAWGAPTKAGTLTTNPFRVTPLADTTTPRGYTGHEMLDHLGLIHMNGRIYDQSIGRFLSADPFVQFLASTQGYNRYTYLNNNPMNATDPSGFFSLRGFILGGVIGAINPQLAGKIQSTIAPFLNFVPGCQVCVRLLPAPPAATCKPAA